MNIKEDNYFSIFIYIRKHEFAWLDKDIILFLTIFEYL